MSGPPVRPPAVAGTFYPADPERLTALVDGLLAAAGPPAAPGAVAVVAPHAGYDYSGPVAATAYTRVDPTALTRVLLLGPIHRPLGVGPVLPAAAAWRTPLGDVPIDHEGRRDLAGHGDAVVDDDEHAHEHALEVQLPFLQRVLDPGWTLLPVGVRPTAAEPLADLIDRATGPGTLVVVSSDLSHYHDDPTAEALDHDTAATLMVGEAAITPEQACGADALNGLRCWAARHGHPVRTLDLRTSGDTAGSRDRVVGYGAFAVG